MSKFLLIPSAIGYGIWEAATYLIETYTNLG